MHIKSELIKRMLRPFWHAYLALKQKILPFYLGKLWTISINMGNYIKQRSIKNKYFCDDSTKIEQLNKNGYVKINMNIDLIDNLSRYCEAKLKQNQVAEDRMKSSHKNIIDILEKSDYCLSNPIVEWALDENNLVIASEYLGYAAILDRIQIIYSQPKDIETTSYSQNWHRDYDDTRIIKMIVFVRDVNKSNGPFTFFNATDSVKIPKYLLYIGHANDENIKKYSKGNLLLENAISLEGTKGAAMMVDTHRCVHQGSRCEKPRLGIFVVYTSGFSKHSNPSINHIIEMRQEIKKSDNIDKLSELQKYAIGIKS